MSGKHIESAFASQSHVKVINTCMTLATTQKGSLTVVEYFSKMKVLVDDMASTEKKLDDEDFISYILAGLDVEYNSVVSSIARRVEPITFAELYSQLMAYENILDLQSGGQGPSQSLANNASRGRGGPSRGRGGRGTSRGGSNSGGRGRGDFFKSKNKFPLCQLCGKTNHPVFKCYKRFDPNYVGEDKSDNAAYSYGVDSNWYADSGATDHVTGELDKLAIKEPYHGGDQICTASGSGMHIKRIGHSLIHTPYHDLKLSNILHVPHSSKSLASVHRIASDNNVFFELHPNVFFIKDQESRRILLQGRSEGGLYPLPCNTSFVTHVKQVFSSNKTPQSRWHSRLGHPSSSIVRFVLSKNSLPFINDVPLDHVCDACQQVKSHQLPYPKSFSTSKAPLELIFSDV
jgi:hypothetical protein